MNTWVSLWESGQMDLRLIRSKQKN
jgi:hypothetical protein